MPGKFVLQKGKTGKFRFNLMASNGQIIATSESYESKAAAVNGIRSVQRTVPTAAVEDLTRPAPAAAPAKKAAKRTAKKTAKKAAKRTAKAAKK